MERGVAVRGRLQGRHIELEEQLDEPDGEVEVLVRHVEHQPAGSPQNIFDFIRSLPPGTRTKDDIDRQLAEDRAGWGDR
jgi:hypothetical protein